MTPKEKALQIYNQFYQIEDVLNDAAKDCALICVAELIEQSSKEDKQVQSYWENVIHEINLINLLS